MDFKPEDLKPYWNDETYNK